MRRWKTAIIGYGSSGRLFHAHLIARAPALELIGIASRDAATRQRIVNEQRVRAYEGMEAVLADRDVELVVIATPHDTHAALAIAALEAGRHVVTDKVMCLGMGEYGRMRQAAERAGRMLTVFHNRRWDGDWLTVNRLREENRLGEVRWVEMAWNRYGPWRGWRGERAKGGGRVYDLGAHLIDQALLLFPQPVTSVHAQFQREWPGFDVESQSMVSIAFDGGARAVIDTGCLTRYAKPRFHVVGTQGTFVKCGVDPQEDAMKAGNIDAAVEPEALYGTLYDGEGEHRVPTLSGRWRTFYEQVGEALNDHAPPPVRLDEMARLIGVLEAAFLSEETGQAIRPGA